MKFAIQRLTAKPDKREWDAGFIWVHGQSNPIPLNKNVLIRHIPVEDVLECIVRGVDDPFDPSQDEIRAPNGQLMAPAREGGSVDGWTYIAVDAINRIDLFKKLEKVEKKIIAPPEGMMIVE
jgi:hypothetical protein